ncbi:MAG TPA: hypothetical protein VE546_16695 [Streptomyces sp.]|uniref:hypothetical protein n=1 Tax=Streptomyces sp. TaxID=1931 RepID=UPI002D74A8B3|nr:hypothetical protein [Streptomyces sp.]HZG05181.1 hypothetical protein [Streptomyces sp.]
MTTTHRTDQTDRMHPTDRTHRPDGTHLPPEPAAGTEPARPEREARPERDTGGTALLSPQEREEFGRRLHHAVNGFVDAPRRSVEEADALFEEISRRISARIAERHHGLRAPWRGEDATAETEDLRNALRRYRDSAEQLLRL